MQSVLTENSDMLLIVTLVTVNKIVPEFDMAMCCALLATPIGCVPNTS